MSKQFIPTATAGAAHNADIYSVAVSKPFTITASGDGYLKFWYNFITESDHAKEHVDSLFVNKSGLHHVDVFEDAVDSKRHVLVATVSFNGTIHFIHVDEKKKIRKLDDGLLAGDPKDAYWAIRWLKDHNGQINRFAATTPTGLTKIWNFTIDDNGTPKFELHGSIKSQAKSFATSLDLNSVGSLLVTGYQNGDVVLTNIESVKSVYTFRSAGVKGSSQSSSSIRSVKFSPLGKILAVAGDSGSHGTISLYDTVYGESIGSLTIPTHSSNTSVGAYAHDGWVFEIDFNESGESLVSAGYDGKLRVWNIQSREREATIALSPSDVDNTDIFQDSSDDSGVSSVFGVKFIKKGTRGGAGGDNNDGLVAISKDRGVRWYREAGGI